MLKKLMCVVLKTNLACFVNYNNDIIPLVSSLTDPEIDESQYTFRAVLSDRLTIFAKIIGDVSSNSFVHAHTPHPCNRMLWQLSIIREFQTVFCVYLHYFDGIFYTRSFCIWQLSA